VEYLDRFVIGQPEAKRAIAISFRNRWRRKELPENLKK
jgi:ATP-dependent HslUV protease ATP-binding subunit HslU